ncbi:hypothetical protein V5799_024578 [Amblyomma americanum]|uniref:Uncharacterized protein n=1 Tax=Amblyomma americanum TaxID=6943 RepID=A0AAQ4EC59_AMBAM
MPDDWKVGKVVPVYKTAHFVIRPTSIRRHAFLPALVIPFKLPGLVRALLQLHRHSFHVQPRTGTAFHTTSPQSPVQ